MKSRILKISAALLIAVIAIAMPSHMAHADTPALLCGLNWSECINTTIAGIVNWAVMGMGYVLALAGWLLNISINLTLHIKDFVATNPSIYTTWRALRDISGMFIIFGLLYAAIQLILNLKTGSFGNLIKNVVVVGLLINFSFFFAGLGIDASNIVSVQLYNAMAPANSLNASAATTNVFKANGGAGIDGGLSDIFMGALKIQTLGTAQTKIDPTGGAASIPPAYTIILGGIVALIIEFVVALSFVAAAAAFILRFVVLLLLLAFSPIWIASYAVPQLKAYSGKWVSQYVAMLQFMPVYLLLMYLALSLMSANPQGLFGGVRDAVNIGGGWNGIFTLGVNAFLICFLLNMPLAVAVGMGGAATSFINNDKIGMGAIWKKINPNWKGMGSAAYQGTISRGASKIADSDRFKNIAANSRVATLALKGTRNVATDYNKKLSEQVETRTKFAESLGYNQKDMNAAQARLRGHQQKLAEARAKKDKISIDVYEKEVGAAKGDVAVIEKSRQDAYSKTVGGTVQPNGTRKGGGSFDTLYLYVARKNKAAGAKIQIPVLEKQLTQKKDSLKELQKDIKDLQTAIRNNPAVKDSAGNEITKAGTPNSEQEKELDTLMKEEAKKTVGVNDVAAQIDNLKLIK